MSVGGFKVDFGLQDGCVVRGLFEDGCVQKVKFSVVQWEFYFDVWYPRIQELFVVFQVFQSSWPDEKDFIQEAEVELGFYVEPCCCLVVQVYEMQVCEIGRGLSTASGIVLFPCLVCDYWDSFSGLFSSWLWFC